MFLQDFSCLCLNLVTCSQHTATYCNTHCLVPCSRICRFTCTHRHPLHLHGQTPTITNLCARSTRFAAKNNNLLFPTCVYSCVYISTCIYIHVHIYIHIYVYSCVCVQEMEKELLRVPNSAEQATHTHKHTAAPAKNMRRTPLPNSAPSAVTHPHTLSHTHTAMSSGSARKRRRSVDGGVAGADESVVMSAISIDEFFSVAACAAE